MDRVIGHVDLDYFYAQVEEVENPSIKDKPVLVCVFSGRTEDSGVVGTANYPARELGIGSGMPIALAKRRLEGTDAVLIPMHHEKYEAVSEKVMDIVRERVDVLEQTGIDEAFFEVTKASAGDYSNARSLAVEIRKAILASEGLTASIGLGRSRIVAKMASDSAKPNGLAVVAPGETEGFLDPLPVIKLYGVGPKTAQALAEIGVRTIGDLAAIEAAKLEKRFGVKTAVYLHEAATGTDDEPVAERQGATQFSRIITLKMDTRDADQVLDELTPALDDLRSRLLSKGVSFRTLSAMGILTDLTIKTRSRTYEVPIDDLSACRDDMQGLLRDLTGSASKELRRAGIRVSSLSTRADQTSLTQFQ